MSFAGGRSSPGALRGVLPPAVAAGAPVISPGAVTDSLGVLRSRPRTHPARQRASRLAQSRSLGRLSNLVVLAVVATRIVSAARSAEIIDQIPENPLGRYREAPVLPALLDPIRG